jgi:hypothetical protein
VSRCDLEEESKVAASGKPVYSDGMGRDRPRGCSDKPRIGLNGGMNAENLRRRDPKSRELLGPLFGQVAVATVRNVLYNGIATLQSADKVLADRVAQLKERKEQLQLMKDEEEHLDQRDESGGDCSLQAEGKHRHFDYTSSIIFSCSTCSESEAM